MITVVPQPGTREFEEFAKKAQHNPASMEAKLLRTIVEEATVEHQKKVRGMLQSMMDLVPGQLFKDIIAFHEKFELPPTEDHGHRLPDDLLKFRLKFMVEELREYAEACGFTISDVEFEPSEFVEFDAEKALDGLLDLVYVAIGTAYLHRFPFNEAWQRVQHANMQKVRASGVDDERSTRKHKADIVKPEGWQPPNHTDLLDEPCSNCSGTGRIPHLIGDDPCVDCVGSGRTKRKSANTGK